MPSTVFPLHSSLPAPLRNFLVSTVRKGRKGWEAFCHFLGNPSDFSKFQAELGQSDGFLISFILQSRMRWAGWNRVFKGDPIMSTHHSDTHDHQPLKRSSAVPCFFQRERPRRCWQKAAGWVPTADLAWCMVFNYPKTTRLWSILHRVLGWSFLCSIWVTPTPKLWANVAMPLMVHTHAPEVAEA